MTGVGWLDATASVAFATLAVVALARLALGWRRIPDRGDLVVDAVMAAGMAAMAIPGGGPVPNAAWVVVFAGAGLRSAFVLGGRLHPRYPRSGKPTGPVAPGWWGRSGSAVHHLGACVLMIVAFGAGHAAHHPGDHTEGAQLTPAIDDSLEAAAQWPIWPTVAGAFALHAVWVATGALSRPAPARRGAGPVRQLVCGTTTERTCSTVMATGMAVMAVAL